jgi:hypothetical protein
MEYGFDKIGISCLICLKRKKVQVVDRLRAELTVVSRIALTPMM